MVRSVAQRRVSNHEAEAYRLAPGPSSFETRFALLRMRRRIDGAR
jgi:hypothetical protein